MGTHLKYTYTIRDRPRTRHLIQHKNKLRGLSPWANYTDRAFNTTQNQKWITFTYFGKETITITQLFKNTNLHIAYKTNNTLRSYLQHKNHDSDKYNRSGIYEIKCNSCQLKYIGQTCRNFRTCYKEHIQAIHTNTTTSRYAQHILDTGHAYGTIEDTLSILYHEKKGPLMNALEQFHIYRLSKDNLHVNDTHTDTYNPIFNLTTKHYK
jgi:hypothetical protein